MDAPYAGARTQSHRCSNPPPAFGIKRGYHSPQRGNANEADEPYTALPFLAQSFSCALISSLRFPRRRLDCDTSRFHPRGRRVVRYHARRASAACAQNVSTGSADLEAAERGIWHADLDGRAPSLGCLPAGGPCICIRIVCPRGKTRLGGQES